MSRTGRLIKRLSVLIFWFGVWAALAALIGKPLLLPSPAAVLVRLAELIATGSFRRTVLLSVCRIMLGIVCACVLGVALAALTSVSALSDALLSPLLTVIKSTPVASIIILMLIWVGRDSVPAIISGLMVLPLVWNNISAGVKGIDRELLEMARLYSLSRFKCFRRIIVPSVMPHFLSALKSSIGIGWKAGVAAEVLTVPSWSIGKMIYESKLYLETTELFAWTLVVVLISLFIEKIVIAALGKTAGRYSKAVKHDA